MTSGKFNPRVSVSSGQMQSLFFDTRIMKKLDATAKAAGDAANAIDGDPNTFWINFESYDAGANSHVTLGLIRANEEFVFRHAHYEKTRCDGESGG